MGKRILGIELGSTRIKSVLTDENAKVIAQGAYEWKNELVDGLWSYPLEQVEIGLQASYADLIKNYGASLESVDFIGISGMMHGYLAFDKNDKLLVPFRTWRNTNTAEAASELSELFRFNVPMRWSVSQYYQSVLENLPHIPEVAFLTTLAGYVHYRLTGQKVLGINDASGMFPVRDNTYDKAMLEKFDSRLKEKGLQVSLENLLPKVMVAGEVAGLLTPEGAAFLDVSGKLRAGIPLCPPEGDMGTGMIATNCVTPGTGNVSAGTSANFTVILGKPLKNYYPEVDIVATPDGFPAALIHTNNCTGELDEWISLFGEVATLFGAEADKSTLFRLLFHKALESDEVCGNLVAFNFLAGESLAHTEKGAPMVVRTQEGKLNLANFMQAQVYAAVATLALGMDILKQEDVSIHSILAHGGFYKTKTVGQLATAAVLEAPVTVMNTAAEGGAWGMALLALYASDPSKSLPEFLDGIFQKEEKSVLAATPEEIAKCRAFMANYRRALAAQAVASQVL